MNNTIGIKLADGTFYPILEEGFEGKKTLDLTTVKDNQSAVLVDLYRSETKSMKDAEYIATLEIDNLVAHPNGEPDFSLNVFLDDNNKLSAEIKDPESGNHNDITINLVSRSENERKAPADFALSAEDKAEGNGLLAAAEEKKTQKEKAAEDAVDVPFSFDSPAISFDETTDDLDDSDSSKKNADSLSLDEIPDDFGKKESEPEKDDSFFELPDFDSLDTKESTAEPVSAEKTDTKEPELNEADFEVPDFDVQEEKKPEQESSNLDFSNLYDRETADGTPSSTAQEAVHKTKKHVIICIICAVICIIATVLVLFVFPSRINLIKSKNTRSQKPQAPVPAVQPAPPPAPAPVPAPAEPPAAKENEIVVPEKPAVLPEAPKPAPEKPKDIRYKIRWGDTLWDLSEAYYKNPWKYHKIAKYNHIKNPDYIISGTYITIPAL